MATETVLVLGSGGREHALCWKLCQSDRLKHVYVMPGNAGTANCPKTSNVPEISGYEKIADWCKEKNIEIVVVGPEKHLEAKVADVLKENNIKCFGPEVDAARIETDKEWAKYFMDRYDIPTARWKSFDNPNDAKNFIKNAPFKATVIKITGLAGGKGVEVAETIDEACNIVDYMYSNKCDFSVDKIVVEEFLEGEEVSVLAFSDGKSVRVMPPVQDHKRLKDGDKGPNTGGMGAVCPLILTEEELSFIEENIIRKTIIKMNEESIPFVGVLYSGLMITSQGIKVLEFNCRFGDPETQVLLPLLETDFYSIVEACCLGTLDSLSLKWQTNKSAVGIAVACEGYPDKAARTETIKDFSENFQTSAPNVSLFHGGTSIVDDNGTIRVSGRAFHVVAVDETLPKALVNTIQACKFVDLPGKQFRKDIGHKALIRNCLKSHKLTYKSAGVDVDLGEKVIKDMKSMIESTFLGKHISPIGSYGATIDAQLKTYDDPVLVTGCDGVGTKLKIAQKFKDPSTVGIDLVAMSVNDILAQGAKPLFLLDYISCGVLEEPLFKGVLESIIKGCREADCALVGGETAEMPGFYKPGEYDLAGFAVGIVERELMIPRNVTEGDKVIYLPSNGIHSNGFSLINRIARDRFIELDDIAPFSAEGLTLKQEFLKPTRIYVKEILPLVEKKLIKAFAHITGGGLIGNVGRVLPSNLKVSLNASQWNILPVFGWIAALGCISEEEMLRAFNCGVGGVIIVDSNNAESVAKLLQTNVIGSVLSRNGDEPQVAIDNFSIALRKVMEPFIPHLLSPTYTNYKRVAVFISGTGSNLNALIKYTINDPLASYRVAYVMSNTPKAAGLTFAKSNGIPYEIIKTPPKGPERDENDKYIIGKLRSENIDIVCLAGYMKILPDTIVNAWRGKMVNIHPSLLPAFKGLRPVKQALDGGVTVTGVTVHFVEPELDAGPIIEQVAVPVEQGDDETTLHQRIQVQEHLLYPRVIQMLALEKIKLNYENNRINRL